MTENKGVSRVRILLVNIGVVSPHLWLVFWAHRMYRISFFSETKKWSKNLTKLDHFQWKGVKITKNNNRWENLPLFTGFYMLYTSQAVFLAQLIETTCFRQLFLFCFFLRNTDVNGEFKYRCSQLVGDFKFAVFSGLLLHVSGWNTTTTTQLHGDFHIPLKKIWARV